MQRPVHATGWNMRPTTNVMLSLAYASDAPWNESVYKNPRIDELLIKTRSELDAAKRQEMYCEMQGLIRDEAGTIIPCHLNYLDAVAKKVKGLSRVPLSNAGGVEWPEFAWLEA
jgi:peptide/nickel transport system substrate-binding protein